jgi:hypothetical protein
LTCRTRDQSNVSCHELFIKSRAELHRVHATIANISL